MPPRRHVNLRAPGNCMKAPKLPIEIQPPEIVAREFKYPRRDIWILIGICLFLRLVLTPVNQAEYTDGVLQAIQFAKPTGSIWPPLYSALVYPLKFVVGFTWAGRLISAIASGLAVIPIYLMARRAFGTRAALYAGIFYIVAPVANRWGIRLMTDATFSLFFWLCCERLCFAADERNEKKARMALSIGALAATLAALTRYQGLMLVPPVLAAAAVVWRRFRRVPLPPLAWLAGLALLPVWITINESRFLHTDQFMDRSIAAPVGLWKVLLLNGEAFALLFPYFITYPVAAFALMGAFQTRLRRGPFLGWLAAYSAVALVVAQSAFSSFQERYFLPLMGFAWVFAGSGMFSLQERWLRSGRPARTRLFPWAMIATFAFCAAFTAATLIGQREAFGDIAAAARFVRRHAPADAPVFTNELYRAEPQLIAANKVEFYLGREASYLGGEYVPSVSPSQPPPRRLPEGAIVILSSAYGADYQLAYLQRWHRLEPLVVEGEADANPFRASLLPLLPDIMEQPGTAQNPLAWNFRYSWQHFSTAVYVVRGVRQPSPGS